MGRTEQSAGFKVRVFLMTKVKKKLTTTVYFTEEQQILLKELSRKSKVPVAEYVRQGIDLILDKNRDMIPGQLSFLLDEDKNNNRK